MTIQELRERLQARHKELKDLLEQNPGNKWNADLQAKYDAGLKEMDDLKAEIGRHQAMLDRFSADALKDSMDQLANRVDHQNRNKNSVVATLHAKWLRRGDNALSAEEWTTLRAAMSTTTGSEGGYTVATEVAKTVMEALKAYGGMRNVAQVIQTEGGNQIDYPTSDGTTEEGEIVDQNADAADQDASFGVVSLGASRFSSKVITVPTELLQDSSVDVESFVNSRLASRLGRVTNRKFTLGTGVNEPTGIVTAAVAGKMGAAGQTATVTFDDLVDMIHSVDPAYRALGRCKWMMHDSTLKAIRKLKDANGRPIYLPGYDSLAGAMPDSIMGFDIQINQHMPVMAANAKSILFGDFFYYVIRDVVGGSSMFRFTDSAYARKGQVGFLMFMRSGGAFTDVGGAVKYYQNAAA